MTSAVTTLKLRILDVPVDELRPNPWNPSIVPPENMQKIERSLTRFGGMFKPLLCRELPDASLEILGGEHRWRAAKKLGYKTVPVINLGSVPDEKAKEIGLADNGRYGEDDTLRLAELLKSLGPIDELGSFLPMNDAEFASIFAATTIPLDALDIVEDDRLPEMPATKPVQTHQVMRFKVPVKDASKIQDRIERVMKEQRFTDEDALANAGNALVHIFAGIGGFGA